MQSHTWYNLELVGKASEAAVFGLFVKKQIVREVSLQTPCEPRAKSDLLRLFVSLSRCGFVDGNIYWSFETENIVLCETFESEHFQQNVPQACDSRPANTRPIDFQSSGSTCVCTVSCYDLEKRGIEEQI